MGKRVGSRAARAPIPSSQPPKRPRKTPAASRAQIGPSSQRLKRPRSLDNSPPETCPSSPRSKRARSLDDAPPAGLCSCSSSSHAEIPSPRVPKRKSYDLRSTAHIRFLRSWGAKRARTAALRRLNCRDWANLEDGPAGLVAELVLANDMRDYIRFRAVCRPWRRCSPDPRACGALDRRFHPRAWIMLREKRADPQSRRFLNVCTGQCVHVDLPELLDHQLLQSTTEGLLVLRCRTTNVIRLLNPLTQQVTELPQIATSLASEFSCDSPDSVGLADDHTVLLYFCGIGTLAFAKPEHWVFVKFDELLMPTISFGDRFYGVTTDAIMVVDTRGGQPPRLVVAAKLAKPFGRMVDTVHLVENGGELMPRKIREIRDAEDCFKRSYKVYRVDLDAGKTTPAHGLSGQAIFIGLYRALSVPPQLYPCIRADTVYPGLNLDERTGHEQIGAYHLTDGSIESSNYDMWRGLAHPSSAVEFLADCVSARLV